MVGSRWWAKSGPGFVGLSVLAWSFAQPSVKHSAQVSGRAETGALGNLVQVQVGLPQQRANPIHPAADDFTTNAGL
jgi:hypothetical protein